MRLQQTFLQRPEAAGKANGCIEIIESPTLWAPDFQHEPFVDLLKDEETLSRARSMRNEWDLRDNDYSRECGRSDDLKRVQPV